MEQQKDLHIVDGGEVWRGRKIVLRVISVVIGVGSVVPGGWPVFVKVIICKLDAASVRVGIVVEVTFDTFHSGLHLRELGAFGVRVSQCSITRCLFLLAFLIKI